MTKDEAWKELVELAEIRWHDVSQAHCHTCRMYVNSAHPRDIFDFQKQHKNLSRHSLGDLFKVAEKLDVLTAGVHMKKRIIGDVAYAGYTYANSRGGDFKTPQEALFLALCKSQGLEVTE